MAHSNLRIPITSVLPPSPVELTLDTSNLVLTTLSNAARMTHVSVLQGVAGLALNIVEIAQNARSNKNAFQRLASDTCALVYVVARYGYKVEATGANVTSEYLEYMKELSETLQEIHKVTKAQVSKNKFLRIVQSKSDAGVIQEYRDSLDVFGVPGFTAPPEIFVITQDRSSISKGTTLKVRSGDMTKVWCQTRNSFSSGLAPARTRVHGVSKSFLPLGLFFHIALAMSKLFSTIARF